MASNLVAWEAIRLGKKLGCKTFDLWGALGPDAPKSHPWQGFTRFKAQTGAKRVEYLGTYDDFSLTALSVQNGKNVSSFIDMGHSDRKDLLAQFMGLTIFDRLYNSANERYKELGMLLKNYQNDEFTKQLMTYIDSLSQAQLVFNNETRSLAELTNKITTIQGSILDETKKIIKVEGNIPSISVSTEEKIKLEKQLASCEGSIEKLKKSYTDLKKETNSIESEVKKMEEMGVAVNYLQYQKFIESRISLTNTIDKKKVIVGHKLEKVEKASSYQYNPSCEYCVKNNGEVVAEAAEAQKSLEQDRMELLKIIDELKKEKYPCIVGPNLTNRSKIELKNLSFENAGILSKNGIMVALMTDHPVIPIRYLVLCAALSVKEGMEEYEALKAITINPAIILGIDDRVGSIEKGKDADIVIMSGHPFDTFSTVDMVLVDGEIAYKAKK